jgi:hypothetical protein
MRVSQSRPINPFPDFSGVKDEIVKKVFNDLSDILSKVHRNIADDISNMQNLDVVDTLPTATSEYRGRMVILKGSGTGADRTYIAIDTGSGGYGWQLK